MNEIRDLIVRLIASGIDPVEAGEVVARAAVAGAASKVDPQAERRRENDRVRKASLRKSAEIRGTDGDGPFPKESPQTPKETPLSLPTTPKEKTPKGVQKKAVRLPDDWVLPAEWREEAVSLGLSPQRIDLEADKMRDWSRSSKNGAKLDWRATWRNWCRDAAPNMPRGSPAPRPIDDLINSLSTRMDRANADTSAEIEGYPAAPRGLPAH